MPSLQSSEDAGYKGSKETAETPVTLVKHFPKVLCIFWGSNHLKVNRGIYQFLNRIGTVNLNAPGVVKNIES